MHAQHDMSIYWVRTGEERNTWQVGEEEKGREGVRLSVSAAWIAATATVVTFMETECNTHTCVLQATGRIWARGRETAEGDLALTADPTYCPYTFAAAQHLPGHHRPDCATAALPAASRLRLACSSPFNGCCGGPSLLAVRTIAVLETISCGKGFLIMYASEAPPDFWYLLVKQYHLLKVGVRDGGGCTHSC